MLCKMILGTYREELYKNLVVDYVDIEWYEAFKKLHRKTTKNGQEIGIQLDDEILTRGLHHGDILYQDDEQIVVVNLLPCQVIVVTVAPDHARMIAKVCYEIGNRHAALFWGTSDLSFVTPYTEPVRLMLSQIHGVTVTVDTQVLDFDRRISAMIHNHTH